MGKKIKVVYGRGEVKRGHGRVLPVGGEDEEERQRPGRVEWPKTKRSLLLQVRRHGGLFNSLQTPGLRARLRTVYGKRAGDHRPIRNRRVCPNILSIDGHGKRTKPCEPKRVENDVDDV